MAKIYILDSDKIYIPNNRTLAIQDSFDKVRKQLHNPDDYIIVGTYYFREITIAIILNEEIYSLFNQIRKQYGRFFVGDLLHIFALPKAEIEQYYIEEMKQEF